MDQQDNALKLSMIDDSLYKRAESAAYNLNQDWEHYNLYELISDCILSLPNHFSCDMRLPNLAIDDIVNLNTSIGSSIESQVISTLNLLRPVWDKNKLYSNYHFVRQPQVFPDVLLKAPLKQTILMGIELKGWYMLSKEGEPSFRYETTPKACATQDLLVVVPWCLDGVISGKPILFQPFITPAKAAACYRNYYWSKLRLTKHSRGIIRPENASPYPKNREAISDHAEYDSGKNFGRLARTGVMDEFVYMIKHKQICGIEVDDWRKFFKKKLKGSPEEQTRNVRI